MRRPLALSALLLTTAAAPAPPVPRAPRPVEVMVVGTFHMANPGRDIHNMQVDDVRTPRRQREIAAVTAGLARFRPTRVAVEWDAPVVAERWPKYASEQLATSRNEVVQLGFRLAREAGAEVHGVDVETDFPFEPVQAYAKAHDRQAVLDAADALVVEKVAAETRLLKTGSVGSALRYLNDPVRLESDNGFYRSTLKIGGGAEQPGAELLTAWCRRNFLICANLVQLAKPGDRIVVLYGSGHAFLLRQCVRETPGFRLVEANAYLPR